MKATRTMRVPRTLKAPIDRVWRQSARNPWSTPVSHRPALVFDKGNTATIMDAAGRLSGDSPAAAIALMDFLTQHDCPEQPFARARLTTLLTRFFPFPAAVQSGRFGLKETQSTGNGQLTAALCRCEVKFLSFIHGSLSVRRRHLPQLAKDLQHVADSFAKRDSLRRQASARIILADVYLRLQDNASANREMSKALVLMGTVYGNRELIALSTAANGPAIIEQTYNGSLDPQASQRARELVSHHLGW